jgi:hypothetical protein
MIANPVNPSGQTDIFTNVLGVQFRAGMAAIGMHRRIPSGFEVCGDTSSDGQEVKRFRTSRRPKKRKDRRGPLVPCAGG